MGTEQESLRETTQGIIEWLRLDNECVCIMNVGKRDVRNKDHYEAGCVQRSLTVDFSHPRRLPAFKQWQWQERVKNNEVIVKGLYPWEKKAVLYLNFQRFHAKGNGITGRKEEEAVIRRGSASFTLLFCSASIFSLVFFYSPMLARAGSFNRLLHSMLRVCSNCGIWTLPEQS